MVKPSKAEIMMGQSESKTVEARTNEIDLDYRITKAKVEAIAEEILLEDGGQDAISKVFEKTNV